MYRRQYKYYAGGDRKMLQALLRDNNFRSTEGRLTLLGILKNAESPLSVADITGKLHKDLNKVNVYRALEALGDAGLLVRSDVRRGGAHYEYAYSHHHHLVCEECGRTEDVRECADKRMEKRVLDTSRTFAAISTHALEFFGVCNACARS